LHILFGKSRFLYYIDVQKNNLFFGKKVKILLLKVLLYAALVLASQTDSLETEFGDIEISISSEPSGATVVFNDEEVGETPVVFRRPEGKYRIILIKEHHKAYYEAVMVKAPEFSKKYTLDDLRANVTIRSYNKAEVFINEERVRSNCPIKVPAGEIKVRVEMDSNAALEKTVVLKEKDNKLFMLYPECPTGMLNVSVNPLIACVEVWEEGVDRYSSSGGKAFANLPVGRYFSRVGCRGYKTQSGELDITAGSVERLDIKLEKRYGHWRKICTRRGRKLYYGRKRTQGRTAVKKGDAVRFLHRQIRNNAGRMGLCDGNRRFYFQRRQPSR
jgi:hypothetical protein